MNYLKKYIKSFFISLFLLGMLVVGYSCSTSSTQDYLDEYEVRRMIEDAIRENNKQLEFTQWKIVNINIKKDDWSWNDAALQWEAFADLPELTEFIYEEGAQLGYVFIGEQGVDEVQKLLPYVETYTADDGNTFTETISCDFQLGNPSTVGFFIKDSQLAKDANAPQNFFFRIVLIW